MKAAWRVLYAHWQADDHDWIGRRLLRRNAKRKLPPLRRHRDFANREAAERFAAQLRRDLGDQVAYTVVDLGQPKPMRPQQLPLSDDWPLQARED